MTAIAGWIDGTGDVWLGSDSAATGGDSQEIWKTPKVFQRDGVGIAYTHSWRFGQLLHHQLVIPPLPSPSKLEWWASVKLVDAIRKCLTEGGWIKKDSERLEGGACLVAVRGRLFILQSDFSVGEVRGRYAAHGSGVHLLYGALHATASLKWHPRKRLTTALKAAAKFSASVAPPFRILKVSKR